jgi:hypothetical protein
MLLSIGVFLAAQMLWRQNRITIGKYNLFLMGSLLEKLGMAISRFTGFLTTS